MLPDDNVITNIQLEKYEDHENSLSFLRKAINAPDKAEVREMVINEIINHNMLNKIELTTDKEVKILADEPRHYLFPEILTAVHANIPVALIGPAGSGKSTVAKQIADALDLKYFLQNSVSGTHELSGYLDAHGRYHTTAFRDSFEFGGVVLIDEVDTSDPGALKWLNTALANGHAMFPDKAEPVQRHNFFRTIIAANTFGNGADRMYVGAIQLDASTLDRFVFFDFGYDETMELALGGNLEWVQNVQKLRAAAVKEKARIVISPRASINGAKLLKAGWEWPVVEQRVIWKGIDNELKERIVKTAGTITFPKHDLNKLFGGAAVNSEPKRGRPSALLNRTDMRNWYVKNAGYIPDNWKARPEVFVKEAA